MGIKNEGNYLWVLGLLLMLFNIAWIGCIIYVALHFVSKFW